MNKGKLFGILMSIMLAVVSMTGCGDSKPGTSASTEVPESTPVDTQAATVSTDSVTSKNQEIHLVVVIGSHVNAPRPNLGLVEEQVYNACYTYGSVTLVCDDGDPYTVVVDLPVQDSNLSDNKKKQIANDQTKQILSAASQMQARTDEVNTLKAIQLGSRSLASAEPNGSDVELVRQMVVLDSCLATTGALSFTDHNLNNIDVDDIISQLKDMDELPTLDNVSVTVYTCGDTAGSKQKSLTESNRHTLQNVWESILEAGNADINMKDDLPLTSIYDEETMPKVTPISVVQDIVDIHDSEDVDDALADGGVISFDEKSIAFKPGTAELADKDAAKQALTYVVEYMGNHPDFKALVCGTTACWGGKDYCQNLSNDRASAVCKLLTEDFGIDKSRVQAVGVGYSFDEFYTYDQTPDGDLDDAIAPVNRSVKLVDLNSDTAARILSMR